MSNVKCLDVNRECEYSEVKTRERKFDEVKTVVLRTIGTDDITDIVPTGRKLVDITTYKKCKYCGNEVILSTETKQVITSETYV